MGLVNNIMENLGPRNCARVNTGIKIVGAAIGAGYVIGGMITRQPLAIMAGSAALTLAALHPKYSEETFERIIYR